MSTPIAAGSLRPARTRTVQINTVQTHSRPIEITVANRDRTRPFLLLHGGGGAATMAGFADLLAERTHSRVLLPTHPGFGGTPKADGLTSVTELAAAYVALLEQLDLTDVTVVGNSFGGWLAAEIGLQHSPRVSGAVIIDGVGIEVEGHPMTDVKGLSPGSGAYNVTVTTLRAPPCHYRVTSGAHIDAFDTQSSGVVPLCGGTFHLSCLICRCPRRSARLSLNQPCSEAVASRYVGQSLSPAEIQSYSFHDRSKVPAPPANGGSGPSPDVRAMIDYTGPAMSDPKLAGRLGGLDIPVHVLWGESDRIVDPDHGRAYAAAIPLSTFTLLPRTGHLPQVESPGELLGALLDLGNQ